MRDNDAKLILETLQFRNWLVVQGFDHTEANKIIEEGMLADAGEWLAKRFAIPLVVATSILGNIGCTDNVCPADAMQQAVADAQAYTQNVSEPDGVEDPGLSPDDQAKIDAFEDPDMKEKWTGKFKERAAEKAKNDLREEIYDMLDRLTSDWPPKEAHTFKMEQDAMMDTFDMAKLKDLHQRVQAALDQ